MNSLIGILAMLAVLATAQAQTCAESGSCMSKSAEIKSATERGDQALLCSLQAEMIKCIQTSLDDCVSSGIDLPAASKEALESVYTTMQKQQATMCEGYNTDGGSSSSGGSMSGGSTSGGSMSANIPEDATCIQITSCLFDADSTMAAINEGRRDDACVTFTASGKCMMSAFNDCKKRNLLEGEQLKSIESQVKETDTLLAKYCNGDGNTVTCLQAQSCVFNIDSLMEAISNQNFDKTCGILRPSYNCLESAIADCEKNGILEKSQLDQLKQSNANTKQQLDQFCTTTDSKVACTDISSCMMDSEKFQAAIEGQRFEESCSLVKTSYNCMTSAINDCEQRQILDKAALDSMKESTGTLKSQMDLYCQETGSEVSCMQMVTCQPDMVRVKQVYKDGQKEEACRLLKPSITCMKSAFMDCKKRNMWPKEMQEAEKMMNEVTKTYCPSAGDNAASTCGSFLHILLGVVSVAAVLRTML